MRALRTLWIAAGLLAAVAGGAQEPLDLAGHWEGEIELPGSPLQVMLDFAHDDGGWRGTIDIPAQAALGLRLIDIEVDARRATFTIEGVPGSPTFSGILRAGELTGDFTQGAARLPFRLGRDAVEPVRRPQDPAPPFPYREVEAAYANGEIRLAGTLTVPEGEGPFPAAVLISGSGAQNRDEELFDHRPFRVLADALGRRGIAVLRSDDRGVGGSSGDVDQSTTADFAADALAAVEWLRARPEIDPRRIGLVGHSEGALVAPLAAVDTDAVAFLVLLAGPGVPGSEILPLQTRKMAEAAGADSATLDRQMELVREMVGLVQEIDDEATLRKRLLSLALEQLELAGKEAQSALGDDPEAVLEGQIERLMTPWFRFFLAHEPGPVLRRVTIPVLALNGSLDLQVDSEQNLRAIAAELERGRNPDVTVRQLEGLNHLFQHARTGAVAEYGRIEETMAPEVLELVGDWIHERFIEGRP